MTTTPRPIAALKAIIGDEETVRTGGTTFANPHLAEAVKAGLARRYAGTRTGQQELEGLWSETLEGALWWPALIEACRAPIPAASAPEAEPVVPWLKRDPRQVHQPGRSRAREAFERVLVGVDPPASPAGTCGIVVAGLRDEIGYVLEDASVAGRSPEGWAAAVAKAAACWAARGVVAEANNGGARWRRYERGGGAGPGRMATRRGQGARAAPVAALFESGRAKFAGRFPELEEQLCGLIQGGGYEGPGRSPDRADACVWALTALLLERRGAPRIARP